MTRLPPDLLLKAYALGVFPMAEDRDDPDVHWIEPHQRGIIPLDRFHVPRRLARRMRRGDLQVRVDTAFDAVIAACAAPTPRRPRTWINDDILDGYRDLHRLGHAHSVETWRDGRLVGGLYGVNLRAAFFGESMFSRETDASKVALVALVERLRTGGFVLLDAQFLTDHLRQFGAIEVPRDHYRRLLARALESDAAF